MYKAFEIAGYSKKDVDEQFSFMINAFKYGAPPLPPKMSLWQTRTAHTAHFLMYFFIGFLILSGIATAINATAPIELFGAIDITNGQIKDDLFKFFRDFHEFATNAVIALIVVHILAALYHQFFAGDDSTKRMLRFWHSDD